MLSNGTIIALSTPQGQGAIGLIRISGPEAISKTKLFFQNLLGFPQKKYQI